MSDFLSPMLSYFDALGVGVAVDNALLTRQFHDLSRRYHPDRYANADADTQMAALESAALLNDAYRTLRDPFLRAEYLLRRERGMKPDDTKNAGTPPQELFSEVLELQEGLMEFQEAQMDEDEAAMTRLRPRLQQARTQFQETYADLKVRLRQLFEQYDAGEKETALDGMAEIAGTRGYLRRVLSNLEKTLT